MLCHVIQEYRVRSQVSSPHGKTINAAERRLPQCAWRSDINAGHCINCFSRWLTTSRTLESISMRSLTRRQACIMVP